MPVYLPPPDSHTHTHTNRKTKYKQFSVCQNISLPEQLLDSSMSLLSSTVLCEDMVPFPTHRNTYVTYRLGSWDRIPLPTHYLRHPSMVGS